MDDVLRSRVSEALAEADPADLARTDQLASLWREFYSARGLDLGDPVVADSALRALTMAYGLLLAYEKSGELDAHSWELVRDVISNSAAAVTVTRTADPAQPRLL